jgi:hypothetical protein
MKKLFVFIALVVLTTSFAFATDVPNVAHVTVQCLPMSFLCHGDANFTISGIGATTTGTATSTTTWDISNNGSTAGGTVFSAIPAGNFGAVTAGPTGWQSTDLTCVPTSGTGWSTSGLDQISSTEHTWRLTDHKCGATGTMTYSYLVTASTNALPGVYTITFTQAFVTL